MAQMAVNEWLTAAMLVAAGLLAADAVSADVGSTPSPAGGAQAQASSSSVTAVLDLVLNTAPRGELLVLLDRGEVWAEVAGLEAAGLTGFSGERMTRGERAFVRLGSIDPPLTVSLDEHALSLSITADVSLLSGKLSFSRRPVVISTGLPTRLSGIRCAAQSACRLVMPGITE